MLLPVRFFSIYKAADLGCLRFNFNTGKWSEISADNSHFQWLQLAREL